MKFLRLNKVLEDVRDDETVAFETLLFNGGESHIKILDNVDDEDVVIECLAMNPYAPMTILLAQDALSRAGAARIELCLPYVPYGRQDRVCNPGEALSVQVFGLMLWSNFSRVWTLDNHSPVTAACIENCFEINRCRLLDDYLSDKEYALLISPDAGALKKTHEIGRRYNMPVVEASKIRDTNDGSICGVQLHGDVDRCDCVVIDDICDGGRSFVELGKVLRAAGAADLHLYVSHGIFSMGQHKLEDIYKTITATTMKRPSLEVPMVQSLQLRKEDICVK